jgi:hypothetical protein
MAVKGETPGPQGEETAEAVEKLKKAGINEDGLPNTNDRGQFIGLDGKGPVSNTNPDPRVVRDTRFL